MKIKDKLIVGIAGKMGSGKDSVASFLHSTRGYTVVRFADALKAACCAIYGWRLEDLENLEFKMTVDPFWGTTPRVILQKFGTEACRNVLDKQIWVKCLERRIRDSKAKRFVIPDVRFINEAQAVKDWGGSLIRVERPGYIPPGLTPEQAGHTSETELDAFTDWSAGIMNDGDLSKLEDGTVLVAKILELNVNRTTKTSS